MDRIRLIISKLKNYSCKYSSRIEKIHFGRIDISFQLFSDRFFERASSALICICNMYYYSSSLYLFVSILVVVKGLTILPGDSPSEKIGRCPRQHANCSRPSSSSKCFFHAECLGNQLCCGTDSCGNTCIDPLKDNLTEPNKGHD